MQEGILNSGHRAGGQVIRTVGDDFEPRAFSTHCPVAIAQIGKLPGTLADRSIHIEMRRASKDEKLDKFRLGRTPELGDLSRKAACSVADNADVIRDCDPNIPDAIFNRAADNWEPLFAIAEVAGADIPERAKKAAREACGIEEEQSLGTLLLSDIRDVFAAKGADRLASAELVEALAAMPERPWPECRKGKPINQNWVARRLKDFGIRTEKVGPESHRLNGYPEASFADAFARYCPETGSQRGQSDTTNKLNHLDENKSGQQKSSCPLRNDANMLNITPLSDCPDQNQESGARVQSSANVPVEKAANPRIGRIEPQSSDTVGDAWEDGF